MGSAVDQVSRRDYESFISTVEQLVDGVWHNCVWFLSSVFAWRVFTAVRIARPWACTGVLRALNFAIIELITRSFMYLWFAIVWLSCCLFY
jgi:hypothetical protein